MTTDSEKIKSIHQFLLERGIPARIEATVILGSGLGGFSECIKDQISFPYSEIPGFPQTTVQGHQGKLIFGKVSGQEILAFAGRFHHYEGHSYQRTLLPVRLAKLFHSSKLIITNAAGAINTRFHVGDLMVIDDLIRPFHPLIRQPDQPYRYNLYEVAEKVLKMGAEIGLSLQRGTYLYVKGPNYESKAEIRAFRTLGADVVGMSTAPELIEASRLNLPTAAISLVTNMAAGVEKGKLDHSEVEEAAKSRKKDFSRLVEELIVRL